MLPFLCCEAMPVFSGGLRGAANAFEAITKARVTTYGQARAKDQQFAHVALGQARAHADVAEILVREQIHRTLDYHAGSGFDLEARLALKGQSGFLVDHCRSTVNDLMSHSGARSFHRAEPLQRFFRDLNMQASHAFWEWILLVSRLEGTGSVLIRRIPCSEVSSSEVTRRDRLVDEFDSEIASDLAKRTIEKIVMPIKWPFSGHAAGVREYAEYGGDRE